MTASTRRRMTTAEQRREQNLALWKEQGGFDPREVPPAPSTSRFLIGRSLAGWRADPAETLADCASWLVPDRVRSMIPLAPKPVEVALRYARADGSLIERGTVRRVPDYENARPGRRWRKLTGGELVDSFLLGEAAWDSAPDSEVFEALAELVRVEGIGGDPLRRLNDVICVLLCLRAGVKVGSDLPVAA